MINQQMLDFIKLQLAKGLNKEIISKELSGSGWTAQDIEEGFNSINSNNINNPISTKVTSHSGRKILLIIVALFIIAGGVSGYYFRYNIPVIKDLIKPMHIEPIIQGENTQTQISPEKVVIPQQEESQVVTTTEQISSSTTQTIKSVILPEKNCGISKDTPDMEAGWESSYKGDPALKCFGESALNCTNAKVVITGGNMLDKNPALLQIINRNDTCLFKYTGYQKKYTQCPLSLVKELDLSKTDLKLSNPTLIFKDIDTSDPAKYSASLFTSMIIMPSMSNEQYQKNGCTGDLYKTMSDLMNKARENSIKNEISSTISSSRAYAEVYFDDKNQENNLGYKGVCLSDLKLLTDKLNKYSKVTCFDTVNSYAVSASFLDGYICADNTGFSGNIAKNITGPSCL